MEQGKKVEKKFSITGHSSSFINWHHVPRIKRFVVNLDVKLDSPDDSGLISPGLGALCEQLKKL